MTPVLISHASDESELAVAWKELICGVFKGITADDVFMSSELGSFTGQANFLDTIYNKFRDCLVVISTQTPSSCKRPWVIFEGGLAIASGKSLYPIIYEPRDVTTADSIFGSKLPNPMAARQCHRGIDLEHVKAVLMMIQDDFQKIKAKRKPMLHIPKLEKLLQEYKESIEKHEHSWVSKRTILEKRIRLSLNQTERNCLFSESILQDSVIVESVNDSLEIFGLGNLETISWINFINHLKSMPLPWPGSAVRWARGLHQWIKSAHAGDTEGDGLPLYYDAKNAKCYRPSITLREDRGPRTYFIISFTLLPPELRIRPTGRSGIFLHYLDFCRMMRWGVLEHPTFVAYFRAPNIHFSPESVLKEFISRILTIRTEFWNRGLKVDALIGATTESNVEKVNIMTKRYLDIINVIDPDDNGVLPNPLPDPIKLQKAYSELLQVNKEYYLFTHKAFGTELNKLADSLTDLRN